MFVEDIQRMCRRLRVVCSIIIFMFCVVIIYIARSITLLYCVHACDRGSRRIHCTRCVLLLCSIGTVKVRILKCSKYEEKGLIGLC